MLWKKRKSEKEKIVEEEYRKEYEKKSKLESIKDESQNLFKSWVKDARKVLSSFIQENPQKMRGFEFREYGNSSDDPNYQNCKVRLFPSERFVIIKRNPVNNICYNGADLGINNQGYDSESLAWEILSPNLSGMQDWYYPYFNNKSRNHLVKEIEEQTGLNLKRKLMEKGY